MQGSQRVSGERTVEGIRSFEKGIELLQALRRAGGPLRLTDLAATTGMTPSAARNYMVSLIRTGLASQDPATGRYDLGEEVLQLGLAALRRTDFLQLAQDALSSLADTLGQTALLAVWSETGPVVVAKTEGQQTSVYEVRIGTHVTLVGTATGQVFMAYRPLADWEPLLPAGESAAGLSETLEAVRLSGFARNRPAKLPERWSISCPVFDHSGSMRGALTLIARDDASAAEMTDRIARALGHAAAALSRRLGYAS